MIRHPELPDPATILKEMLGSPEMPKRIDGPPETPEERMAAFEALQRIGANPDNIRIICIACSNDVPLLASSPCICGGFVCPACQRLEEDGVCDHVPPGFEDDADA